MGRVTSSPITAHDPDPRPLRPPEWTPPGVPPLTPPSPPAPTRPVLPVFYEPEEPAGDDVLGQLLARRIIMLTGTIDGRSADDASARLLLLDQQSHDPVTLHLSTPDAELDAALSLLATIDLVAVPIHAVAAGSLGGAAVAVFAATTRRRAHPHATFLLFEPKGDLRGDAEQLTVAAEHHRQQLERLAERIAQTCGRDIEDVAHDLRAGRLLTATQAVDYGLVQELTS